jgi:hypothetical protein
MSRIDEAEEMLAALRNLPPNHPSAVDIYGGLVDLFSEAVDESCSIKFPSFLKWLWPPTRRRFDRADVEGQKECTALNEACREANKIVRRQIAHRLGTETE